MNHIVDFDRHYKVCVTYWLKGKMNIILLAYMKYILINEKIIYLKWYNQLNYFTLNELWTSVSSRSITMHFFPTSSDRISGSSCFVDLLWLFCFSRQRSPDPDAPDPPIPLPLPIEKDPRSFFPFLYFVLFFPKQQIMEHRKLDLFFVSKITQQNLFKWFILLSSLSFKGNIKPWY